MFTPIKIQRSASSTPQPGKHSTSNNSHQLKTPVSVGSLSVLRLRQLIKEQNNNETNNVQQQHEPNQLSHPVLLHQQYQNISRRRNQDDRNHVIISNNSKTSPPLPSHFASQFDIASDLSAIAGGAPVAKLFLHMTSSTTPTPGNDNFVNDEEEENYNQSLQQLSPIRAKNSKIPRNNKNISNSFLDNEKAKLLDDELTLKLLGTTQQQKQQALPLQVAMHCREMGMKIADALPLKSNTSSLLKRIIEVLVTFGEEQHAVSLEQQAKCKTLEGQLYEFRDAHREFEAQKRHKENLRLKKQRENSYQGLQERYKHMSKVLELNDDGDDDDNEEEGGDGADNNGEKEDEEDKTLTAEAKDRKRMIKQLVNVQGLLAAERDAVLQAAQLREGLQRRLETQLAQQEAREKDQRELILQNSRRYDELEQKMGSKNGEIFSLRSDIKDLQSELDDKLWLGTVEVESSEVAMAMLRKHAKDMESRCAITLMRLRQEQELVTKLKRKLADLGSSYQELAKRQSDRENMQPTLANNENASFSGAPLSPTTNNNNNTLTPSRNENAEANNNVVVSSPPANSAEVVAAIDASAVALDPAVLALELLQDQRRAARDLKDVEDTVKAVDAVGSGAVISSISTPRPDKEAIVRNVPSLGRAQIGMVPTRKKNYENNNNNNVKDEKNGVVNDDDDDDGDSDVDNPDAKNGGKQFNANRAAKIAASASTASIVEALISIIKTQEERIKLESRSWETAQEEADKALEERKEKTKIVKIDAEVQASL